MLRGVLQRSGLAHCACKVAPVVLFNQSKRNRQVLPGVLYAAGPQTGRRGPQGFGLDRPPRACGWCGWWCCAACFDIQQLPRNSSHSSCPRPGPRGQRRLCRLLCVRCCILERICQSRPARKHAAKLVAQMPPPPRLRASSSDAVSSAGRKAASARQCRRPACSRLPMACETPLLPPLLRLWL